MSFRPEWRFPYFSNEVLLVPRSDLRPDERSAAIALSLAGPHVDWWFNGWWTDDYFARQKLLEICRTLNQGFLTGANTISTRQLRDSVTEALERGMLVALKVPARRYWIQKSETKISELDDETEPETSWIEFKLIHAETGKPISDVTLSIQLPNGDVKVKTSSMNGRLSLRNIHPGNCRLTTELRGAKLNQVYHLASGETRPGSAPVVQHDQVLKDVRRTGLARVEKVRVKTGDTLESLSRTAGFTPERLAEFNWGTSDPEALKNILPQAVGCTRKDKAGNYLFDDTDEPGIVYVPHSVNMGDLATGRSYTLRLLPMAPVVESLESRLALEQLEGLAHVMLEKEFLAWFALIFGDDIELETYKKFRQALLDGKVENAKIQVVTGGLSGHEAGYDNLGHVIRVDRQLVQAAQADNEKAWELLIVLVHEFGHHVDNILRTQYSNVGGDSPLEEGAAFSYALLDLQYQKHTSAKFGRYTREEKTVELSVEFAGLKKAINEWANIRSQIEKGEGGAIEYFEAGRGDDNRPGMSFGHESIEDALPPEFDINERPLVYFGNWLRDYSQFVDPKLVRSSGQATHRYATSRWALTYIVQLNAWNKFGKDEEFFIKPEILGVYRPEQHIDNPKGLEDGSKFDPDFRSHWRPEEVALDPVLMMKNYIATSGRGWATSADYVQSELTQAVANGRSPEGMRHFGAALHTLEDFFAHSNFVELLLRELGYTSVVVWAAPVLNGKVPVVTGRFGGLDTLASLLLTCAEKIQHGGETLGKSVSSQRVEMSQWLLPLLLEPLQINWGLTAGGLILKGQQIEQQYAAFFRLGRFTLEWLSGLVVLSIAKIIKSIGSTIEDAQAEFDFNLFSTDPTHTQLAKDHEDHPFHVLAANLAQVAVADVGRAMLDAWNGRLPATEVVRRANAYLLHPSRLNLSEAREQIVSLARDWAASPKNQTHIRDASSKMFWERWLKDISHGWGQMNHKVALLESKVGVSERTKEALA